MMNATLLIVDDVPANLKLLFNYLAQHHFRVLIAQNGYDALEQLGVTQPDLILLDVLMPGIDGYETCRRIKHHPAGRDVPVIFMTALSETIDKVKGFEAGAVDYVTKPAQCEEVLARVNTHISLRRMQKSLETQAELLRQQNRELEAFAHTVAHDLKNPLNVISALNSLLHNKLAEHGDPQISQCIGMIRQSAENMDKIIHSLLLLAKVRVEDARLEAIDMPEILRQCRLQLHQLLQDHQAELLIEDLEHWPAAKAYAPWIEEVWANYLSNAVKYGGKPPRVCLSARRQDDGQVRFSVCDNGPGLSAEAQKALFLPFHRLHKASKIEGHGLGLSIVQRIIEKCGGQVGVECQIGAGCCFYFTLPAV